ncbi:MAG: hypothetical protein A2293_13255 [Elusimicrobia bacterium RIFOXYB2_FULL_49_7]|nr:MAG: hypothetical protein A2293_13255 [Elusimicrobia bacterium RIFOXYB2_FULL_49_7]
MSLPLFLCLTLLTLLSAAPKPNIALMDLAGSGLSPDELTTLSNRLRAELLETESFVVVERGRMELILREQGFQQSGCTDASCAVEAGQLLNVEQIVLGSIDRIGRLYSINLRAVSVKNSEVLKNIKSDLVDASIEDLMITGLRKAARQLAGLTIQEEIATPVQLRGRKTIRYKGSSTSREVGSLTITVQPADADIFLDDSAYGKGSMVIDCVPVGRHRLRSTRPEFRKMRTDVEIFRDQETVANLVLNGRTPFYLSPRAALFYKRTNLRRSLTYSANDSVSTDYLNYDLDHTTPLPFSPSLALGWESGRDRIGFSLFAFPGFHKEVTFLTADADTVCFETENMTFGGFFEYWYAFVNIPKILDFGGGFFGGYLWQEIGLNPEDALSVSGKRYSFFGTDKILRIQYIHFGGPMLCLKAGYKHVFLVVSDRLLLGIKRETKTTDNTAASPYYTPTDQTDTKASFSIQNSVSGGLLFLF